MFLFNLQRNFFAKLKCQKWNGDAKFRWFHSLYWMNRQTWFTDFSFKIWFIELSICILFDHSYNVTWSNTIIYYEIGMKKEGPIRMSLFLLCYFYDMNDSSNEIDRPNWLSKRRKISISFFIFLSKTHLIFIMFDSLDWTMIATNWRKWKSFML